MWGAGIFWPHASGSCGLDTPPSSPLPAARNGAHLDVVGFQRAGGRHQPAGLRGALDQSADDGRKGGFGRIADIPGSLLPDTVQSALYLPCVVAPRPVVPGGPLSARLL